jgi:hypothetical protein
MKIRKALLPIAILFIVVNTLCLSLGGRLRTMGLDTEVLILGNLAVFAVTGLSAWILLRGLRTAKTMAFIRSVYTSFIVKFFLVAVAVLVYAWLAGDALNRPAVFLTMFLYLLYTFLEVKVLLTLMKEKPDVQERSTP